MKALGHVCRCPEFKKRGLDEAEVCKKHRGQKHALNGDLEQGARIYMEWDSA